jgi:hypothetical protein
MPVDGIDDRLNRDGVVTGGCQQMRIAVPFVASALALPVPPPTQLSFILLKLAPRDAPNLLHVNFVFQSFLKQVATPSAPGT